MTSVTTIPRALLVLAALAVAACGTSGPVRPGADNPETVTRSINLSGFPPEFRQGFTDGCAAARAGHAGARPKAGGQYGAGWHDGFDYCSPQNAN
jgi:predicted small lipoprotein YifL